MNDHKGLLGLLSTCLKSYGAAASTRKKEKKPSGNLCAFCAQWQNLLIRPFFLKKRAQEGSAAATSILLLSSLLLQHHQRQTR